MLALLAVMLGVFVARDLLLFYVFFELTLIPMFFHHRDLGRARATACRGKFFLFTFTGGVLTLAAALYLGIHAGSFDISTSRRLRAEQSQPHRALVGGARICSPVLR